MTGMTEFEISHSYVINSWGDSTDAFAWPPLTLIRCDVSAYIWIAKGFTWTNIYTCYDFIFRDLSTKKNPLRFGIHKIVTLKILMLVR